MEVIILRRCLIAIASLMVLVSRSRAASTTSGQDPQQDIKPRQGTVSDFLGQLGALASQGNAPNGTGGYLQGVLQQYYLNQQFQNRPLYRKYAQRPLPFSGDNVQNLQHQQNVVLGQTPGGGFGLRPGSRPGALLGLNSGLNPGTGHYPQFYQGFRPPLAPSPSLTGALQSVARYDDARCVPRLLCEVTAGGTPGSSRDTALPFVNRDTLLSLLTVLNFGNDLPLVVFGRAALLGYMAQGDPATCLSAYPTCPRDPDLLVDYLNNHNGGFFRFFNPSSVNQNFYQQQQYLQQQYLKQQYLQQQYLQQQNQLGQYYAPKFRENNHFDAGKKHVSIQSRILTALQPNEAPDPSFFPNHHKQSFTSNVDSGTRAGRNYNFKFPTKEQTSGVATTQTTFKFSESEESRTEPPPGARQEFIFHGEAINQQLLEPSANGQLPTFTLEDGEYTFVNPYTQTANKNGDMVKTFTFPHIRVGSPTDELSQSEDRPLPYVPVFQQKPATPMNFPDKTGTGDLLLDFDESFLSPNGNPYGNHAPPVYSASSTNVRGQNTRGVRLRFPKDDEDTRYS